MSQTITVLMTTLSGLAMWTFLEYALHNWAGHVAKGKTDFSREHLQHHALAHYFTPAWKKLCTAAAVLVVLTPMAMIFIDPLKGGVLSVTIVTAYLGYEWLHRRAHTHAPRTRYGRWLRKHHFSHHFNNPKHNHGVTSALWDYVFHTITPVTQVRVPRKHAMVWLVCPNTGDVLPEFGADYCIVEVRR